MALSPRFNPSQPIPNNPFYTPETYQLCSSYGCLVVGSGLTVNYNSGVISAGGSAGTVTSLIAGPGISVSAPSGNVTVSNTGLTALSVVSPISSTGGTTPSLSLQPSGVMAGTYNLATVQVDALGRILSASSGSLPVASTTVLGIVRLATTADVQAGTDATSAVTPLALSSAFIPKSQFTTKGQILAATGVSSPTALSVGSDAQVLTACSACPTGLTWAAVPAPAIPCACITAKGALVTGSAANSPATLAIGVDGTFLKANSVCPLGMEWAVACQGTVTAITAGTGLLGGTVTTSGTIAIDTTCVLTSDLLPTKGSLVTATAANVATSLPVGLSSQILSVNLACPSGLAWVNPPAPAIPCACIISKGGLVTGTAANTPVALPVGVDCQYLMANSACPTGLMWTSSGILGDTPVGAVSFFASGSIPTGWLVADGRAVSRVQYSDLFGVIGTIYGSGDGLTTFNLPDLRGMFLRGVDNAGGTPRNCDPGRVLGSNQCWATESITGCITGISQTFGSCAFPDSPTPGNVFWKASAGPVAGSTPTTTDSSNAGTFCFSSSLDSLTSTTGVDETRPMNVAMLPCIKWMVTAAPASCGIPISCVVAKGSLITGAAANTPVALPPGTNGQVLLACSSCPEGLTWGVPSAGSVTTINTGTGLTGGPISSSGTIALSDTAVIPGSYTNASFTVDAQGRLTAASSGTNPVTSVTGTAPIAVTAGATPVVSIASASTTSAGAVQLYNNTDSTSTTLALTAAQGKNLQDQINALGVTSNLTLAGTFNAASGTMMSVTAAGTVAGFTVGSNIPAAAAGNLDYFVIVETSGNYSPPGGGGPFAASKGDWFLSTGTSWQFLNVGPEYPYATTGTPGIVCLTTNAIAQAGVDSTTAITPAAGSATYVMRSCYPAKGSIVAGSAANTPTALSVGTDGQILVADSACALGVKWGTLPSSGIPCGCITAKGALISGTAASTPTAVSVGTDGQILTACAACPTGLTWVTPAAGASSATPLIQGLLYGCTALILNNTSLGYLSVCAPTSGGCNVGVGLCAGKAITSGCYNNALGAFALSSVTIGCNNIGIGTGAGSCITSGSGNVIIGSYTSVGQATDFCRVIISDGFGNFRLGFNGCGALSFAGTTSANYGTAGQVLQTNGEFARPTWVTLPPSGIPCSCITAKGSILTGTAASTPISLSVGTDGQILVACSTCTTGLAWINQTVDIPCSAIISRGDILVGQAAATPVALSVGTNGQVLTANSACALGVSWATPLTYVSSITAGTGLTGGTISTSGTIALANTTVTPGSYTYSSITVDAQGRITSATSGSTPICKAEILAKGNIIAGTGAGAICALAVGTDGQVLTACSTCASGVTWATAASGGIPCSTLTATGAILIGAQAGVPTSFVTGGSANNGRVLAVCTACVCSLAWIDPIANAIPRSCVTAKGALITGTAASTPVALPVGSNGQFLAADSACPSGLKWSSLSSTVIPATSCTCGAMFGCVTSGSPRVAGPGTVPTCNTVLGYGAFYGAGTFTPIDPGSIQNVALGTYALHSPGTSCRTVAIGADALGAQAGGYYCNVVAIGYCAGFNTNGVTGSVYIGSGAGSCSAVGSYNTSIGLNAGCFTCGSGNISIGPSGCGFAPACDITGFTNNIISMGHRGISNAYVNVAWQTVSDVRDKIVKGPVALGLEFVENLNPITYEFRENRESDTPREGGRIHYGFSAQEILELEGENPVIINDDDPEKLFIGADNLNAVFAKAIKELAAEYRETVSALKQEIADLKEQLNSLQS